ncbi:MAG: cation diffusion facilitator family transporter [Magnetococcales bacterium]|nr:cation diffusion facilitator family transporter [Magnetococcales bacterium]
MKFRRCPTCVHAAVWSDFFFTLAQALFQTAIAFVSGSMALHAQGIYSFADFTTKGINLVSVKMAARFPQLPFISAALIGLCLIGGASLFLIHNFQVASSEPSHIPNLLAFFGSLLSALASELMFRYLACVGQENSYPAITAAAWDNRMDALSSLAVFVGVLAAYLGWPAADHWVAVAVALLVVWVGGKIVVDALQHLLDVW